MQAYIYGIKNNINNQYYIGQTINYKSRVHKHKSDLRLGNHCNSHLQRSYNKYGEEAFTYEILEVVEDYSTIGERERSWIDKIGYYNIDKGREGFTPTALRNIQTAPVSNKDKRKLTGSQVFHILALTDFIDSLVRPLSRIFSLSRQPFKSLIARTSYLEYCARYDNFPLEKKLAILEYALSKYQIKYVALDFGFFTPMRYTYIWHLATSCKLPHKEIASIFKITSDSVSRAVCRVRRREREIDTNYQTKEIIMILRVLIKDNPVLSSIDLEKV